ncbi:MAG: DUF2894 domain-containing protein [Haliea sp.]|nr:DUF2894 domain-containing protein [Haliea sp.]
MSTVLKQRLYALAEAGAKTCAPARFARAQALLEYIEREPLPPHVLRLQAPLMRQLDALQQALDEHVEGAARGSDPWPGRTALAALPPALQRGVQAMSPPSPRRALEARLRLQELEAFGGVDTPQAEVATEGLVAARRYRESHAAQVVAQLLLEFRAALPEAPGPLNPETLVIRALAKLQSVSPEYVERLMRHAEVLCTVQRAAKAAAPAPAARPRRRKPAKA